MAICVPVTSPILVPAPASKRFGRVILRHGVAAIPRAIFTHQAILGLTPQQVRFISYIFSFQWDTSLPYPSIRRMATTTSYSSVQIYNIKGELVEQKKIRMIRNVSRKKIRKI